MYLSRTLLDWTILTPRKFKGAHILNSSLKQLKIRKLALLFPFTEAYLSERLDNLHLYYNTTTISYMSLLRGLL